MAATHEITCQECGHREETTGKNTIRCATCRLVRNLSWVRNRTAKCWLCKAKYAPIARDDGLCGECAHTPATAKTIDCVFCGGHKRSVAQDIAVCGSCARDPLNRRSFLDAVLKRQERQLAQQAGAT